MPISTCVDENVFLEIRILVKLFRAELASERTDAGMNQPVRG